MALFQVYQIDRQECGESNLGIWVVDTFDVDAQDMPSAIDTAIARFRAVKRHSYDRSHPDHKARVSFEDYCQPEAYRWAVEAV